MALGENMTVFTWSAMGSTTILTDLQEIANKERLWVTILTETKPTDIKADAQHTCHNTSSTMAVNFPKVQGVQICQDMQLCGSP